MVSILDLFYDIINYFNKGKTNFLEIDQNKVILLLIDGITIGQARILSEDVRVLSSLSIP